MELNISTLDISKIKRTKLQNIGIHYLDELDEIFRNSLNLNVPETKSALEILARQLISGCILSYIRELDIVLRDEIVAKRIIELTGLPGSGKTQVCFQLCITTQLPHVIGGAEGHVVYFNTNKNFSQRRLAELTKIFLENLKSNSCANITWQSILKNIFVFNIRNFEQLFASITYLETFLPNKKVKLVIIDSFTYPFKQVNIEDRTCLIYNFMEKLQNVANAYDFAVVLTNDMTTRILEEKASYVPSFGDSFFHRVNTRIKLSKADHGFYAEIIKSPTKVPVKTIFKI
ncbi:DNA repair protein RAD51 homolog 3-like [Cylas formicarius]|uniref:DNA repair protein RAD51 homolog 3-like n=1 Tax=Cylas formicarius TaxID=197179 RepID=UPI0029589A72|nr:DNA repair protein RAD51 homolog 3-like [Cylas formicarius]